jgi:hemerythrin-like domain-containing protein
MDAAEALARHLATSDEPEDAFQRNREDVKEFLEFLTCEETQHEKEEERILLPVLERQLDDTEATPPKMSMERVCREHAEGQVLVNDLKRELDHIDSGADMAVRERYYRFSEALLDLVWHFRRHVSLENSMILPAAEELIPDSRDELWAGEVSKLGNMDE